MVFIRILIFFQVISTFPLVSTQPQECKHPLPFLAKTAAGIDITKLDLYPIGPSNNNNNGFGDNVFAYECNDGKWRDLDSTEYDVPDEFVKSSGLRSYSDSKDPNSRWGGQSAYSIDQTMLEAKKSGLRHIESAAFFEAKDAQINRLFTQNRKYQSLLKQYYGSGKIFVHIASGDRSYKVEPNLEDRKLSKDFVEFVTKKLPPKYEDNPALYRQFVQRFGTHFFQYGFFGFNHYLQVALNQKYALKQSDKQRMCNLKDAFYKEFNILVDFDILNYGWDMCEVDEEFVKNSEVILSYGGDESKWVDKVSGQTFLADNKNSVEQLIWVYLKDLSNLINDDNIRAQVQIAIRMYLIKAYLAELKNVYNYTSYQLSNEENVSLALVETMLKANDTQNMDQMDKIIDNLYNKVSVFTDKKFCSPILYDIYVLANMKFEYAKNICASRFTRRCVSEEIFYEQKDVNQLFNWYAKDQEDQNQDCAKNVRKLNHKYQILNDRVNGLKVNCTRCP